MQVILNEARQGNFSFFICLFGCLSFLLAYKRYKKDYPKQEQEKFIVEKQTVIEDNMPSPRELALKEFLSIQMFALDKKKKDDTVIVSGNQLVVQLCPSFVQAQVLPNQDFTGSYNVIITGERDGISREGLTCSVVKRVLEDLFESRGLYRVPEMFEEGKDE